MAIALLQNEYDDEPEHPPTIFQKKDMSDECTEIGNGGPDQVHHT